MRSVSLRLLCFTAVYFLNDGNVQTKGREWIAVRRIHAKKAKSEMLQWHWKQADLVVASRTPLAVLVCVGGKGNHTFRDK